MGGMQAKANLKSSVILLSHYIKLYHLLMGWVTFFLSNVLSNYIIVAKGYVMGYVTWNRYFSLLSGKSYHFRFFSTISQVECKMNIDAGSNLWKLQNSDLRKRMFSFDGVLKFSYVFYELSDNGFVPWNHLWYQSLSFLLFLLLVFSNYSIIFFLYF